MLARQLPKSKRHVSYIVHFLTRFNTFFSFLQAIADAMGGCLFLDEAYALGGTDQGVDSYASDAIRTLLTEVENNRTSILVVLAGYRDKMNRLLAAGKKLLVLQFAVCSLR